MIDTHCHLTNPRLCDELDAVVERACEAGVEHCISIGTGVEDARNVADLTRRFQGFVFGTAGLDPFTSHRAGAGFDDELTRLAELLRGGGFLAVGEIGLDYHYDLDAKPVQIERFERQLELAVELDLPVVIHVREAHDDMRRVLAAHGQTRGVIHSFTGGPAEAEAYLDLGWYLAFNGVLTFKRAEAVREAAKLVPVDRLLVETDSPYLAPVPSRGKRCEPAYVAHTLNRLAEVREVSPAKLDDQTSSAARALFAIESHGGRD